MGVWCSLQRRDLARHAVSRRPVAPASSLGRHLERCAACRSAWQEVSRLVESLPQGRSLPAPSESLLPAVLAGVAARSVRPAAGESRRRLLNPLVPGALVGLALAAFVALLPDAGIRVPVRDGTFVARSNAPEADGTTDATPEMTRAPSVRARPLERTAVRMRDPHRGRLGRPGRRLVRHPLARRPETGRHAPQPFKAAPTPRDQWIATGLWYESCGDDCVAAAAYAEAYAAGPDQLLAFAAGRTAERTGEVAQAVRLYAELLGGPSGPTEEEPR